MTIIKKEINIDVLGVLKYNGKEIYIDYVTIDKLFTKEKNDLKKLCKHQKEYLLEIIDYLSKTESIKVLQGQYKYCKKLDDSFQGFSLILNDKIKTIKEKREHFYLKLKAIKDYDIQADVISLKLELLDEFDVWVAAFCIQKAYEKCIADKEILAFSHRINGWSNPEYILSENFRIEIKTNFGYGSASYFYVKIKYKEIDVSPFSEWIDYEFAQYAEIIRYSKSFATRMYNGTYNGKQVFKKIIHNTNWNDALEYAKEACNVSLKSENDFIKEYIIGECDKMVSGLESLYSESELTFIGQNNSHYNVSKEGHQLMEFRGEKISGALDFINKIIEYERITEVKQFIRKIENINKKLQPLLIKELNDINVKLNKLSADLEAIKPKHKILLSKKTDYDKKRIVIRLSKRVYNNKREKINIDYIFLEEYPEYKDFEIELINITEQHNTLNEKIHHLKNLFENITSYNNRIDEYFKPLFSR